MPTRLMDQPPKFNVFDHLKFGDCPTVYRVVGLATDPECRAKDGEIIVSLEVFAHGRFIPDDDDPESEAEYYRVPMSILKAAKPLVSKYRPPAFDEPADPATQEGA